jgi:two-component system sensor histidine kinase BaeS
MANRQDHNDGLVSLTRLKSAVGRATNYSRDFSSPIARQVALLIMAVALLSLATLSVASLVLANNDVRTLSLQQRHDLATATVSAVAAGYRQSNSWRDADLTPVLTLATHAGVAVTVRDSAGTTIASAYPAGVRPGALGPSLTLPVLVQGSNVGSVVIRVGTSGIESVGGHLRHALAGGILLSAVALALLAILVGVIFSRKITRPVTALTTAARSLTSGERGVQVGDLHAVGELADLSKAFNVMVATLEKENNFRQTLVANVAHELRTPLAILQATSEAMAAGVIPAESARLISLHDDVMRLAHLVQDLEVIASSDVEQFKLDIRRIDLAQVVGRAADVMEPQLEEANLRLFRHLAPVIVYGDSIRLHQVVLNLLTNAIKFTPTGGSVTLSTRSAQATADIVVNDTGRGIAVDDVPHIFERFWRGPSVRTVPGSGIGLAVVMELVTAHGGTVTVTSAKGYGSTFVITLPCCGPSAP